jgi:hypothetical protein
MKLTLKKFDITRIHAKCVVLMIGSRNSGKSFIVRDLLYHHQDIPMGLCISGTESANEFFSKMVPACFIHEKYTPELLQKYVKRQQLITKKMNKEIKTYGSTKIDPRSFLVMDDCLYDKKWPNDENIRACFLNGRHFNTFFIFTSQYALAAPPILRNNIDFVFILREPRFLTRKKLHDNYCGFIPSFDVFSQIMDATTENYECLVCDNTTKSNKIIDQLFWYKAEKRPDFRLCNQEFWMISKDESDDEEDEEFYDITSLPLKKNSLKLNIQKGY